MSRQPRLALLSFRDIVVTPYKDLLGRPLGKEVHRGGPHWPHWSTQTAARHCRRGVPVDVKPHRADPTAVLTGSLAWGGAITPLFGHQIADFSTRLLPTLAEMPNARFGFSLRDKYTDEMGTWDGTPSFFRDILDWYGISGESVEIIVEPTLVRHLVVAPQAEQYGGPGPEPWYLDLLDAHSASRLGRVERTGPLYVSRAGQRSRFAGEVYLERVLEEVGFRVLRPETVAIEDQMRAYAAADSIVFAEGSALHGAQLLGRALGDVTVLARRPGFTLGRRELQPRARSLRYLDALRGVLHGLVPGGRPWLAGGLSVLDPDKLLATLPLDSAWDHNEFRAAAATDVEQWLETERASRRWTVPGAAEAISENLRALGLPHDVH